MSALDAAQMMLQMAGKDIKAMRSMLDPDLVDDEIFGFHAQQAVEKSLKAWIDRVGGTYSFTHDLERLFYELEQLGCSVAPFENLADMSAFAVQFRYCMMGLEDVPLDRDDILRRVLDLYNHIQSLPVKSTP